jgi:hypothetical protein
MGILFIVAVLLAWPTYGISILLWIGLSLARGALRGVANKRREQVRDILSPLFSNDFGGFFNALDIPVVGGYEFTSEESIQCGRHIVNYLAHNPSEAAIFIKGLERWRTKGDANLCDPITAARDEKELDAKCEVHLTSYRAIEAIMTNNKNLRCFHMVDYGRVIEYKLHIELQNVFNAA